MSVTWACINSVTSVIGRVRTLLNLSLFGYLITLINTTEHFQIPSKFLYSLAGRDISFFYGTRGFIRAFKSVCCVIRS